ncbi:hypothetical protein BGZ97_006825 [Linnemannia gamsii]|uniref:FAD-binding PCMH-type domain-containing protein n=1 Tax=Linnemannia gamsii TaxID=64522 RepID=A0A9P6QP21_9FUNG|nr:hypothetical protein BGZ97_006825 [Linnemannia gamsii]
MTSPLPSFTEIYERGAPHYTEHCYQYASSSYPLGLIQPKCIIYPKNDDEVIKAIQYAEANKLAVAIRTGGHQYSGASSTYGNNIQLDLSKTYHDFRWQNTDHTLVTVGISYSLFEFHNELKANHRFVPHGQCSHVHLGGHVQTGGYGQLGRSFGLLADHVQKIRIITADCQPREIQRGVEEDSDLFFAVLGGSPGNFGVVTHVTLVVHRDQDHPQSRGLRILYPYDRDRLKRLLDVMVRMADNELFQADYDYCVSVSSGGSLIFPSSFSPSIDRTMRKNHPKIFGHDGQYIWPATIFVYAQWANLGGQSQPYSSVFFDEIKEAGGEHGTFQNEIEQAGGHILQSIFLGAKVDDDKPHPLSELMGDWIFPNVREFEKPYIKRVYMSNSQTLAQDYWTDNVSDRIHEIQGNADNGCDLAVQIQHYGGKNSRFYQNNDGSTALSWRDSNICCVLDIFHDDNPAARETARAWQQRNDACVGHPGAVFCKEDRRVLWGSHDLNLDKEHDRYYDNAGAILSETKYERLCKIKARVDPSGVFTPNGFCVGAPSTEVADIE